MMTTVHSVSRIFTWTNVLVPNEHSTFS